MHGRVRGGTGDRRSRWNHVSAMIARVAVVTQTIGFWCVLGCMGMLLAPRTSGEESPWTSAASLTPPHRPTIATRHLHRSRQPAGTTATDPFAMPGGGGWNFFAGLDGSKQPQDYGVNANFGARVAAELSGKIPLGENFGFQIGTALDSSDNAVQVFELLGEDTQRFQSHNTAGLFYRGDRIGFGVVYDVLYQDGFDETTLGQWRTRLAYRWKPCDELAITARMRSFDDEATFDATPVTLRSIDQIDLQWRHFWGTGAQTTGWIGVAEEHGESNAVIGAARPHDEAFVMGADVLCPLATTLAIYGETHLMMPADTGTVDAFLGLVWYPGRNVRTARRGRYDAMLPMASDTTFSVDLLP